MSDRGADPEAPVYVTYWMNRLQNIDPAVPLFVSLNAPVAPRDELVEARFDYDHPLFDGATLAAQAELPAIQGRRRVWFCGAWCGYGFHEDGLKAGLAVARGLGVEPPWTLGEAAPTPDARPLPVPALQPAGGD
jgi:predicted NAD/FAD-binding protein